MPTLPPGQIETRRFPVVGEREPSGDISDWALIISGMVATPTTLDLTSLLEIVSADVTFDIHCVTSWTRFESTFTGVPLRHLIQPLPGGRFVSFGSYSTRGHHTSLPLEYAREHSWVVHAFEGQPLAVEHGGPVRIVTPGRYFYKSIKWLRSIEVLAEDRLGWWETNSSYHNNADPTTGKERFTTGSLRPEQLRRFLDAANYDKYRGRVMLGLDLTAWSPSTRDLRRLYLKNCDLSRVDLSGADLRESNLSLSRLIGAELVGADLSGSDLEGADFTGADLSGADLSRCALSATRFDGARLEGARFYDSWGLLEDQQAYLIGCGVSLPGQ
ncbi:MAG TPA: molybdopterin-dependent oxidoreductase [Acidimicrobiia bacterium]|nr:molybdopterin-dependent oxidoreductase [Acidimicrobiia bacterium]